MTAERFTLDSNILVYAADSLAGARHGLAAELVVAAAAGDCVLSLQSLSEFFHAVTRKGKLDRKAAADQVMDWMTLFGTMAPSEAALAAALDLVVAKRTGFWDGLLVATAQEANCSLLLSEDFHDGMRFGKLTILNPFDGDVLAMEVRGVLGMGR
ncbi:MAG: PIN domain-containing protein [Dongiaceae bacterium]